MEVNVKMEMLSEEEVCDADDPQSVEEEWGGRRREVKQEEGACEGEMIVPDIKEEPHDVSNL